VEKLNSFCKTTGLHPLVGFGMLAVDWMLFGAEAATLEVSWPISIAIAAALTIPCTLIQKYSFGDSWGASIGKSLLVGVVTAVPTALPSVVPLAGGVAGTIKMLTDGKTNASRASG